MLWLRGAYPGSPSLITRVINFELFQPMHIGWNSTSTLQTNRWTDGQPDGRLTIVIPP